MRQTAAIVVGVLGLALLGAPAAGQDPYSLPFNQEVRTAAAAAVTAHADGDTARLTELADSPSADPWFVVQALLCDGHADTAAALADAGDGPDIEALPAYVKAQVASPAKDLRELKVAVQQARSAQAAVELLSAHEPGQDVLSIELAIIHSDALNAARDHEAAETIALAAADQAEELGWLARCDLALTNAQSAASKRQSFPRLAAIGERRLALAQKRGSRRTEMTVARDLAMAVLRTGEIPRAIELAERSVAIATEIGTVADRATSANMLGIVCYNGRQFAAARDAWEKATRLATEAGDRQFLVGLTVNLGNAASRLGDKDRAIELYREGIAGARAQGVTRYEATGLNSLGSTLESIGRYDEALTTFEESLDLCRRIGNRQGAATALANMGVVETGFGRFERAEGLYRESLAVSRELGDQLGAASTLTKLGQLRMYRGDNADALALFEEALAIHRRTQRPELITGALYWVGWIYDHIGLADKALAAQEESEALARQTGYGPAIVRTLVLRAKIAGTQDDAETQLACAEEIGRISGGRDTTYRNVMSLALRDLGRFDEALTVHEEELALLDERGAPVEHAKALVNYGATLYKAGRTEDALARLAEARTLALEIGTTRVAAKALAEAARIHFEAGDHAKVMELAKESVRLSALQVRGLSEELGASARENRSGFHEDGVRAAATIGDAESALSLLESIRAGGLLESLGGRDALREAALPEDLRQDELAARGRVRQAQDQVASATQARKLKQMRAARTELAAAQSGLLEAVDRLQRAAKGSANLLYPEAIETSALREALRPGEAYVGFAYSHATVAAVIMEAGELRTATIATDDALEAAIDAVSKAGDAERDVAPAIADLRKRLVAPLGLGDGTRTVLIAPAGRLAATPFALLFPERDVAYVPSATTLALLRSEAGTPGDSVLALGDPDYTGRKLAQLPGTRGEVEAIGDTQLLGEGATETALRAEIAKRKRWRAIHLACHGLVLPETPLLSSLALTADKAAGDDGSLTVHEIFAMDLPADLVTLSACETARGKVYRAEGVMGFARAIMLAGSPRAIVSQWKVDDEATAALMKRFYALWNPADASTALPAATALRRAQEHVREQDGWSHPFYWAAWSLWGLPE